MIGGGFLGQMNENMKKNRDMVRDSLGKTKRKAFDNGQYPSTGDKKLLDTGKNLTDSQRQELIDKIKEEQRRETIRKIVVLLVAVSLLVIVYLGLSFFIK
jgi:hypothetical protein